VSREVPMGPFDRATERSMPARLNGLAESNDVSRLAAHTAHETRSPASEEAAGIADRANTEQPDRAERQFDGVTLHKRRRLGEPGHVMDCTPEHHSVVGGERIDLIDRTHVRSEARVAQQVTNRLCDALRGPVSSGVSHENLHVGGRRRAARSRPSGLFKPREAAAPAGGRRSRGRRARASCRSRS
jgi:hypothetical protein